MGSRLLAMVLGLSWREVIWTTLLGGISGLCSAGVIVVVSGILAGDQAISSATTVTFVGLAVVALFSRVVSQYLVIAFAQRRVYELRVELARRTLATPLATLERIGTGKILAVLTEDVQAVTDAVGGVPFLFVNIATVVGCLGYLCWLSVPTFVMVCAFFGGGLLVYRWIERQALAAIKEARYAQDRLVEHMTLMTKGLKELLIHRTRRLTFLERTFEPSARSVQEHILRGLSVYAIAGACAQLLLFALLGLLVFGIGGLREASRSEMIAFCVVLLYMLRPIDFVLHILPFIGRAEVSLAKIESLGLSRANGAHAESAARPRSWTSIELAAVEYTYREADPDDAFALGPIDLVLRPAEIVYLVGGNGSGKSTLAKLLTGLYEPAGGEIRLDGKVVTAVNREEYRQYFTAIFADACVFSKLPTAEIQQPRIEQYLAELHLADKVTLAGDELTTSGLSQGQYKRLALVCAYLEDRPIYVFDEWAADQDPVFREVFYREILQELKRRGKLVVVISHDERFFDVADRLLKLEEGRLVETSVSIS